MNQNDDSISNFHLLFFSLPVPFAGVTILLSLTVFLNLVAESMPTTSDAVPLIGTTPNNKKNIHPFALFYLPIYHPHLPKKNKFLETFKIKRQKKIQLAYTQCYVFFCLCLLRFSVNHSRAHFAGNVFLFVCMLDYIDDNCWIFLFC